MVTGALPAPRKPWLSKLAAAGKAVASATLTVAKARSRPVMAHLRDHAYSIFAFGCIDAAGFTHSVFAGLLVTGLTALVFEWKVSE